ncbi:3'-5' exonuclease [Thiovibrio frasassiensis]|uniref:3'-5' exonuclease n=1 Tax=Thiovibrio frasassiensis TaxID=2984131 RepID=A0A9X4MJC6_9BACT|nr:3'-5' exonuclease [Thiovibrio frasassiensis]MDG4476578.1 3'-5' exonuclease [Thiovibrio frasassiensis]
MVNLLKPSSWFASPDPLIIQNREIFSRFDQSRPLTEYTFVVCDTELTGFDLKHDEIISIGAVLIRDLQIDLGATFHRYIKPKNTQHTPATLIHRITPQQLAESPPLEEVLPAFVEFAGSSLVVGHCVSLDMAFLNRAARKVLGGTLSNPGIDTIRMARGYRRVLSGHFHGEEDWSRSYALEALAKEYHLPTFKSHDAFEDAMQTAYLFLFLLKKFRKGGLLTLKEIYQAGRI